MSRFVVSAFADEISTDVSVQLDVLERLDIHHVEVRLLDGKNLVYHPLDATRSYRKKLAERGFRVSSVGSPVGKVPITEDFAPQLELFKHTLQVARTLECQYVRMFTFFMPTGVDPRTYRDEVMRRWKRFIDAARGSGVILLHENEKGIYGDTAERCLDLVETMGCPYVKLVFDPANFVQCDVETYPHAFEMLRDHVTYVHVKDALFSDHTVTPAGMGDGKVTQILSALSRGGYDGFLSLEPHLSKFQGWGGLPPDALRDSFTEGGPRQMALAARSLFQIMKGLPTEGEILTRKAGDQ